MAGWRDIKRAALRDVHREMRVPAVYTTNGGTTVLRVNVRVHTDIRPVASGDGPKFIDATPRLVFDQSEIAAPLARALVVFGPTEMYRLGPSRPPKDTFVAVEVIPLTVAETVLALAAIQAVPGFPAAAWDEILDAITPEDPEAEWEVEGGTGQVLVLEYPDNDLSGYAVSGGVGQVVVTGA